MNINASDVKNLREKTGAGMMDCKKALAECGGDFDKAMEHLRKKGMADAAKKAGRIASEGLVHAYIHGGGRIGVLLEVNCETDFVARTEKFKEFVNNVSLHIAAANPKWLNAEAADTSAVEKEKNFLIEQAKESGKPMQVIEKMVEGRMSKFFKENCLVEQPFVKNPDITVGDYLKALVAEIGENIQIRRYTRYELGEGLEKRSNDLAAEVAAQIAKA